jgi:hypothetical protein
MSDSPSGPSIWSMRLHDTLSFEMPQGIVACCGWAGMDIHLGWYEHGGAGALQPVLGAGGGCRAVYQVNGCEDV